MMLDISKKENKNKNPDVSYCRNCPSIRNLEHKLNQSSKEPANTKGSYQDPFYLGHNLSSSPSITVHLIDNEENTEAKAV